MRLHKRLERLEALDRRSQVTKVWLATEDNHEQGLFHLNDGRTLTEKELATLPGEGPGISGIIVYLARDP